MWVDTITYTWTHTFVFTVLTNIICKIFILKFKIRLLLTDFSILIPERK